MQKRQRWFEATWLALAVCGLAGSVAAAHSRAGYLPALGPAPLRFQPARLDLPVIPRRASQQSQTPGPTEQASVSASAVPMPGEELLTIHPLHPPEPVREPDANSYVPPQAAPAASPAAVGTINPNSIGILLNPGATNAMPEQFLPYPFVPPPPPLPPPPSTATYEVR